jgi:geranylgeranyl pyrophosphate synthase
MGKQVGRDADLHKQTFPKLFGLDECTARAETAVREATDAIRDFGPQADHLRAIARFVLERAAPREAGHAKEQGQAAP